jgi:hypothetical protein
MYLAPTMFCLASMFLAGLAVLVTIQIDMPTLSDRSGGQLDAGFPSASAGPKFAPDEAASASANALSSPLLVWLMLLAWPVFVLETVYLWLSRPWTKSYWTTHLHGFACCVCPPLKMGARWPELAGAMWLPVIGWSIPAEELKHKLVQSLSLPMLGIAVLILPVLGVEFFLQEQVHRYPALRYSLHFGTGLIWFAFATEFIIMISLAERKFEYCKQHWLDLAIILLPLISFLRSIQLLRATRLAKFTKVQQLSRMARVYRLRGVSTRALRALVLIEVVNRLWPASPKKQLHRLYQERQQLTRKLSGIENKIAELEKAQQSFSQPAQPTDD